MPEAPYWIYVWSDEVQGGLLRGWSKNKRRALRWIKEHNDLVACVINLPTFTRFVARGGPPWPSSTPLSTIRV